MERTQIMTYVKNVISIEKKKNELKRLKYKLALLGNIVEEDEQIKCYIDKSLLARYLKSHEILKLEEINHEKTVYVFSNIVFEKYIKIIAPRVTLVFENCTFNKGLNVIETNLLILNNNKYANLSKLQLPYSIKSVLTGKVMDLIISNNQDYLDIDVDAQKEINIIHSKLTSKGHINLKAPSVNMYFSSISDLVQINANKINCFNCTTLPEKDQVLLKRKEEK